jgi:hypothetical protein
MDIVDNFNMVIHHSNITEFFRKIYFREVNFFDDKPQVSSRYNIIFFGGGVYMADL